MVRRFRQTDHKTPLVLMGYYNPIHAFGTARFAKEAALAGVDGLITVDLPPEYDPVDRAGKIIAVDVNDRKKEWAMKFGATDFINPSALPQGQSIQERLIAETDGGCDYTFDCTGNVHVMRSALEACHKGWGESIVRFPFFFD